MSTTEVVIKCGHGLTNQDEHFIQRYRWSVSKAVWVAAMSNTGPRLLTPDGKQQLKCPICKETVPARHEKLVQILDRVAGAGVSNLSLSALNRALSMIR